MNNEKKFIKLTPFKMQVLQSFPFIDEDFDAITNYELLCKVVEYLNKTVSNVDLLNEKIEEFQHYFDNLDVQDEINNKLDEMAESGELADIIAQYLGLAGVLAYNTVADMKSAENLVDGSIAKTLGFNSLNDGGSALYKIRTITNNDVIDEASIISLSDNNLIAEYIKNGDIYVEQFGAYGDGTTDDSSAIQKAINYLGTSGGKIKFYAKTYKVTNTINITERAITLEGVQSNLQSTGTILKASENENQPLIKVYNSDKKIIGGAIKNIALYGSDIRYEQLNSVNRQGLHIYNTAEFMLDNVNINGFLQEGLYANQWWDSTVYNLQVTACGSNTNNKYAVYLTSTTDSTNSIKFTSCHFEANDRQLKIDNLASHIHFVSCKFENGTGSDSISISAGVYTVMFDTCFFTQNGDGTNPVFNIQNNHTIINSSAFTEGTSGTGYWINHNGNGNNTGNGLIITSCDFNGCNATHAFNFCSNVVFESNQITMNNSSVDNINIVYSAKIEGNIFRINNTNNSTVINYSSTVRGGSLKDNEFYGFGAKIINGPSRNAGVDLKKHGVITTLTSGNTLNFDIPYSDYWINTAGLTLAIGTTGHLGATTTFYCNQSTTFTGASNKPSITVPAGSAITFTFIENGLKWWITNYYVI